MKKGKSRNKRKKTRSRILWIAIAVIGIAAVISAVCVAGMLATKENAWRTPEELLVEYIFGWNRSGQVGKQRGSNRTDCRTIGNHTGSDRKETVCKVGKG